MSARPISCGEISRALVIKLRHHGDVLLTTPVFTALKQAAPQCEIDALIYAETAPMLAGNPVVAQIHTVDKQLRHGSLLRRAAAEWRLFSALHARRYDLLIHLTENWRGAWLARALRPRYSVAVFSPLLPPHAFWANAFTHLAPTPPLGNRHTVECHLDALRAIGLQPASTMRKLGFEPGEAAHRNIAAVMDGHKVPAGRLVHIHPTSRWMFKAWSVDAYAEVISALEERGHRVVLTAGPARREMDMAAAIVARCRKPPIDLAGRLSLKELGAVIAAARLSISIDSVPMHIAAAVGTPVVALFGPSNENEWCPWQVPHRIVTSAAHPCRPCRLDGCGGGKISECLMALSPSSVLAAVESLLAETA